MPTWKNPCLGSLESPKGAPTKQQTETPKQERVPRGVSTRRREYGMPTPSWTALTVVEGATRVGSSGGVGQDNERSGVHGGGSCLYGVWSARPELNIARGLLIRSHRFDRLQSVANTGCPMSQTVHVVYIYSSGSHQITKLKPIFEKIEVSTAQMYPKVRGTARDDGVIGKSRYKSDTCSVLKRRRV